MENEGLTLRVGAIATIQLWKYANIQQKMKFKLAFAHKVGTSSLYKQSIESKNFFYETKLQIKELLLQKCHKVWFLTLQRRGYIAT